MALPLTTQRDRMLHDIGRDVQYVNDAISVGNALEARRFAVTLQRNVNDLLVILSKIEKKEARLNHG